MGCTGTEKQTEFEYIRTVRNREPGECRGPLVRLSFSAYSAAVIEESLRSQVAVDLLWGGFLPDWSPDRMTFELCAAHWMDLSYLAGIRARQFDHAEWMSEASALIRKICEGAGWDTKEIANMLTWQRTLT